MWKSIRRGWLIRSILPAVLVLIVFFRADSAFYAPTRGHPIPPIASTHRVDEIRIPVEQERISAWVLEPLVEEASGTVVFCHGNAGNLENHVGFVDFLPEFGYRVLLFDYRGYGDSSPRTPTRESTLADTRAALAFVESRWGKPFLMGHSLGACLAIVAAGEAPQSTRAVVASAPFTAYRAEARAALRGNPITWLFAWPLSFAISGGHDPIDFVARISPTPLLLIHCEKDEIVPSRMSRELHAAARDPKNLLILKAGGHNDDWSALGEEYTRTVIEFLGKSR